VDRYLISGKRNKKKTRNYTNRYFSLPLLKHTIQSCFAFLTRQNTCFSYQILKVSSISYKSNYRPTEIKLSVLILFYSEFIIEETQASTLGLLDRIFFSFFNIHSNF